MIFIVPLKSAQVSRDWSLASALCERTLRSVCAQTSGDFCVTLVCHEPPRMSFRHPSLEIVSRPDLPIPTSLAEQRHDKWVKARIGLLTQRPRAPFHAMIMDADDCVSNRLAGWVASHPDSPGWYFDRGYVHDEGTRTLFVHRHRFDLMCGTSSILRCVSNEIPNGLEGPVTSYPMLRYGHSKIVDHMQSVGRPLCRLPFCGAVYIRNAGETLSDFTLSRWRSRRIAIRKLFSTRRLTSRLAAEYGLYPLPAATLSPAPVQPGSGTAS